jgi:hypothetical protein
MISNLEPMPGTHPPPFARPISNDHDPQSGFNNWGSYIVARLGSEFQIGDLLVRRVGGDQFLIWNSDGEMLQSESSKVESMLRDFLNEEF